MLELLGSAEQWAAFSDEWNKRATLPPSIRFLSTRDAATLTGQFGRFTPEQRDAKIDALMAITHSYDFQLVHAAVDLTAFESYRPQIAQKAKKQRGDSLLQTFVGQPYFFCFLQLAVSLATVLRHQVAQGERFEWYLDEKKNLSWRVEAWYPLLVEMLMVDQQAIMPVRPIFRDDEKEAPLQIADFVAYVASAELSGKSHPFEAGFNRLKVEFSDACMTYHADALREFFTFNGPPDATYLNPNLSKDDAMKRLRTMLGR